MKTSSKSVETLKKIKNHISGITLMSDFTKLQMI